MIDDGHGFCPAGHRKAPKGSKKHPGCKGGSKHVKKAVRKVKRAGAAVAKATVEVAKTAVVPTGRAVRGAYRFVEEHADAIAEAAGVVAFAACIVVSGGLCGPLAVAALVSTVFQSGVDNVLSGDPNWGAFFRDSAVAVAMFYAGVKIGKYSKGLEKGIRLRGYQSVVAKGYGIGARFGGELDAPRRTVRAGGHR